MTAFIFVVDTTMLLVVRPCSLVGPCHHGVYRSQFSDGGNGLLMLIVAENI